jgi:hypothetical protein
MSLIRKLGVLAAGVALVTVSCHVSGGPSPKDYPPKRAALLSVQRPAQTEGVLSNYYGDAKFNQTSGLWRVASGSSTDVLIVPQSGGYYSMQDEYTGNYLQYYSGGVGETASYGAPRTEWMRTYCGSGAGAIWINVYEAEQEAGGELAGLNPGTNLYFNDGTCQTAASVWIFSGTL